MFAINTISKCVTKRNNFVCRLERSLNIQDNVLVTKRNMHLEKCQRSNRTCKEVCVVPPDCHEQPKSSKLFTIATIGIAGTSLAVYIAKHDDEFRDWVKDNIPQLDSLVAVVYQEDETYNEFLQRIYNQLTQGFKNVLYNIVQGIKNSGTDQTQPSHQMSKSIQCKTDFRADASAFVIKDEEDSKGIVPPELKHLKLLEDKLFDDADEAMKKCKLSLEALKEKRKFIENLDQMISKHDCKLWDKFQKKVDEEMMFADTFAEDIKQMKLSAENLQLQMNSTPELSEEMKKNCQTNIQNTLAAVHNANECLNNYINNQSFANSYWDKVRKARMYFSDILEILFPNVWLNDAKLNLPSEQLPKFAGYVLRDIIFLEKELYKMQAVVCPEVKNAVVPAEGDQDAKQALIDTFVNLDSIKENRIRHGELQKALLQNEGKCEKTNKESLKKLTEVYQDLKAEALAVAEREAERKMEQLRAKQLADIRANHQMEIAKMVGRLQGVNEAIAQRDDNEKNQQINQQFWSAAQLLLAAVKPVGTSKKSKDPKPLKNEILKLTNAAPESDDFVKTVLDTIPDEVAECGVMSIDKLKESFGVVEKQARAVAGLPSGPVSLMQVALAKLQSILYIDPPITQEELNNEPIDVGELNNYNLLQRARYYIERDNLDMALRYCNLLEGPSSLITSQWRKEVMLYLETVQAAQVLLAHATSSL